MAVKTEVRTPTGIYEVTVLEGESIEQAKARGQEYSKRIASGENVTQINREIRNKDYYSGQQNANDYLTRAKELEGSKGYYNPETKTTTYIKTVDKPSTQNQEPSRAETTPKQEPKSARLLYETIVSKTGDVTGTIINALGIGGERVAYDRTPYKSAGDALQRKVVNPRRRDAEFSKGVARGVISTPLALISLPLGIEQIATKPVETAKAIGTQYLANPIGFGGEFLGTSLGFTGISSGIKTASSKISPKTYVGKAIIIPSKKAGTVIGTAREAGYPTSKPFYFGTKYFEAGRGTFAAKTVLKTGRKSSVDYIAGFTKPLTKKLTASIGVSQKGGRLAGLSLQKASKTLNIGKVSKGVAASFQEGGARLGLDYFSITPSKSGSLKILRPSTTTKTAAQTTAKSVLGQLSKTKNRALPGLNVPKTGLKSAQALKQSTARSVLRFDSPTTPPRARTFALPRTRTSQKVSDNIKFRTPGKPSSRSRPRVQPAVLPKSLITPNIGFKSAIKTVPKPFTTPKSNSKSLGFSIPFLSSARTKGFRGPRIKQDQLFKPRNRAKGLSFGVRTRYTPSVSSILTGFTGKKPKKEVFSGLELRPVLKRGKRKLPF